MTSRNGPDFLPNATPTKNNMSNTDIHTGSPAVWGDAKSVARIFGITRTPLYRMMAAGLIKSASLQLEGSERGKRLFHLPSIAELLESRSTGGTSR